MTDWTSAGTVAFTGVIQVFTVLALLQVAVSLMGKVIALLTRTAKKEAARD